MGPTLRKPDHQRGKMSITIDVYKSSGKWYTGETVEGPDLDIWDPEFDQFIWDHLPARVSDGYIVVKDTGAGSGFHNCLLRYEDLKRMTK